MTAVRNQADTFVVPDASNPTIEGIFQTHVEAIQNCVNAHSFRLDILRSTLTAFKNGVESRTDRSEQLATNYVVNLMEALEALVPSEQELDDGVNDAWRDVRRLSDAQNVATQAPPIGNTRAKRAKRASREAIVGSAA
ncbi:MAG: hypothetical protein ABL916_24340 [Burkholderiaceae bacterium]